MYCALVLLGSLLAVSAEVHYGVLPHKYVGHAIDETPKPYQFAYQAAAIGGASARQETADGSGTVVGSYSLSDEDGRQRVVDYVADAAGFRASVKTNEPGTKSESPADAPTVSAATDVSRVAPAAYSTAYHTPYRYGAYGLGHRAYPYGAHHGLGYGHHYGGLGYGQYYGGLGHYHAGALGYGGLLGYGGHRGYYGGYHPLGRHYGLGYGYGRHY